jgi:uncharacterized protein DUF4012
MDSPDRFGSADRLGSAVRSRPRDASVPELGDEEPASVPGAPASIADLPTARLPRVSLPRHSGALRRVRRQRAARLLLQRRGRARTIVLAVLCVAVLLLATGAGGGILLGVRAARLAMTLRSAQDHVHHAQSVAKQLSVSPFDHTLLLQLRADVAATDSDLTDAQAEAAALGPATRLPGIQGRASDGLTLLSMGHELASAGREALDAAIPILAAVSPAAAATGGSTAAPTSTVSPDGTATSATPATPSAAQPAVPALTLDQLTQARAVLSDVRTHITRAETLRRAIRDPSGLGASVTSLLATFDRITPALPQAFDDADTLLQAAPALLGVQQPASYLLELLDSAELRAGGGFIGNYGIVTVAGGRVESATVRDTYLLDNAARRVLPFPPEYSWFHLAPAMGLRDSNLSPDFTANAQVAERIYEQESGDTVNGVIAITPRFISGLLTLTGPIVVPGYNETVTSENLEAKIHFYQAHPEITGTLPAGTNTSERKRFTSVLGEMVFARLRTLPPAQLHGALTIVRDALSAKDLQVYINDPGVYALLDRAHLTSTLPPFTGDTLTLVDDNVGINKASQYTTETASDDVTIGADGSVTHTLTINYAYDPHDDPYDPQGVTGFFDEIQVYVPAGAQLLHWSGLLSLDRVRHVGMRDIFGGGIGLAPHFSHTVTLTWAVPAPANPTSAYSLLLTRQAGSTYALTVTIHSPAPACPLPAGSPLALSDGVPTYAIPGLKSDTTLNIAWQAAGAAHSCP